MRNLLQAIIICIVITACSSKEQKGINTCERDNPTEDLAWLKRIKESFQQTASLSRKEIYQYNFNGENVYYIDDCVSCNDSQQIVYNCKGEKICEFGGIMGLNSCPDFFNKAVNRKLLWPTTPEVLIDKKLYESVKTDNYTVKEAWIDKDILTLEISASGCDGDSWEVKLIDASIISADNPNRLLKIALKNEEACQAYLTKEFKFNISELQISDKNELSIAIENWTKELKYNY